MKQPFDIHQLRSYFPVTENYIFFNNAAESPMHVLTKEAVDEFYNLACYAPHKKPDIRWQVKDQLAQLLGGKADEYALVTSTGIGVGTVALGMKWQAGDNIVLPEDEHRNNLYPWLHLQDKGVEIRFVPVADNGFIKLSDFEKLIDDQTKLVALAGVRFNSGFRLPLKAISNLAHEHKALLLVDAIQAAGQVPLNVEEMNIDILCSAGFKWLLGLPGTGFLYIKKEIQPYINPALPGMFAASHMNQVLNFHKDARQYETGSIAYSQFYGWLKGLELLNQLGVHNIHQRILKLTDLIIKGFKLRNISILSPIDEADQRSGILFCSLGSEDKNQFFLEALEKENIIIALRDKKCRISPSFYNTEEEIQKFFKVLDKILTSIE